MRVQWISVKEKLPEYDEDVLLVCWDGRDMVIGFRCSSDSEDEHYKPSNYGNSLGGVTHWMKLPSLPPQKGEK